MNEIDYDKYSKEYNPDSFWEKVKKFAKKAGVKVIYAALKLYYAAQSDSTPAWAKGVIYGALGYFILPVDLIPDIMPGVGFTDDLAVLAAALITVAAHITPDVKNQSREKLSQWFGDVSDSELE